MLFQTANCILNYIGGVLKYFQCLGYQKISIWVEAQVWRSPRSEGVALLLDGVTLVAPRATLEPGPGEAAAAHSLYMGVCASHKGEGEFKGQQRMTWELKEGKSRTKVGGGNRRERKRKKRGLFSYSGPGRQRSMAHSPLLLLSYTRIRARSKTFPGSGNCSQDIRELPLNLEAPVPPSWEKEPIISCLLRCF